VHGYAPGIRIGIHFGEVEAEGQSIRGAAVHQAARLCAAADPDAILVSREALEASGRPIQDMTRLSLKGIKSDVEAAELAWDR
jgi:class 3 adenylate cyclase